MAHANSRSERFVERVTSFSLLAGLLAMSVGASVAYASFADCYATSASYGSHTYKNPDCNIGAYCPNNDSCTVVSYTPMQGVVERTCSCVDGAGHPYTAVGWNPACDLKTTTAAMSSIVTCIKVSCGNTCGDEVYGLPVPVGDGWACPCN